MLVASVNIGSARQLDLGRRTVTTGICKQPVDGPARIGRLGVAGDAVMDHRHHGGADQAVYVYGGADYDWWSRESGERVAPGTFGENITIAGMESAGFAIGDRLHIGGSVVLEVTAPRIPCAVLAARMGSGQFVKRFRDAGRPGLYCRVIAEGDVRRGDQVAIMPTQGDRVTALELFRDFYRPADSAAELRRYLAAPLAERVRRDKTVQLERILAADVG